MPKKPGRSLTVPLSAFLRKINESAKIKIFLLFLLALGLRTYGLDWDQGQHLHPDERFLTMVGSDIKLPNSISQYFNTAASPLNPSNYPSYKFFVYGTFPLFITKLIAVIFGMDDYSKIHFVGRILSAVFDSGNIILLFYLSKKIWPSLLYATCVLPLQLSHFFAVDTFLTFFILLTFTLLINKRYLFSGLVFGIALACKISAIYFLPIIFLYLLINKKIFFTIYFLFFTFLSFRFFQPYAFISLFSINPHFISNLRELQAMSNPDASFPPSVQWLSKTPLIYSLQNLTLWGLGLPLSILFVLSIFKTKIKNNLRIIGLPLLWILFLFFYQGSQFVHAMRYLFPIYPFICLITGYLLKAKRHPLTIFLLTIHVLYTISFLSIYSRSHSRIQASLWIHQNLPNNSSITNESWDDALPLSPSNISLRTYQNQMISPYDSDTPEKWELLNPILLSTDFMLLTSNRLWGSIPHVPDRYPLMSKYYQDLFSNKTNFTKLIEINSYPGLNLSFLKKCFYFGPSNFPGIKNPWFTIDSDCLYPGIYLRDDIAEEAFSVYDHPKVLIFQNISK